MRNSAAELLSQEQTHRGRRTTRVTIGRCLRDAYERERRRPVPERLKKLLAQLDAEGPASNEA